MPTLKTDRLPKYRKHKASGQALVTLAGKDHYLGPHGTVASKLEYDRLIVKWLANGRPCRVHHDSDITVTQLLAHFWIFAKQHYVKKGVPTSSAGNYKRAIKLLRSEFGELAVSDFGPLGLARLQQIMVERGYSRSHINDNTSRIKRIIKWGVSRELVDVSVHQRISTVEGLEKGRTKARESKKVRPVNDAIVDATMKHMPPIVADMIRIQRLTGARPGETRLMKAGEVHKTLESLEQVLDPDFVFTWVEGVWIYLPDSHKTEHHDCVRIIPLGPRAQKILSPYLEKAEDGEYCFSPSKSEELRRQQAQQNRNTPANYGNKRGSNRKRKPKRTPRDHYCKDSYGKAVKRACEKAFPIPDGLSDADIKRWKQKYFWAPNRIRHTAGTEIRKKFGLEPAQAVLGHSRANTTQIYAEKNMQKAIEVIQEIG